MTDHGDERLSEAAPQRCTIGELAEQMGMTVRNIRAYQARGLLPPPLVDGRVGYYTQAHRERLTMIRRLRAEGFNLVAISALLTGALPVTAPAEGGTDLSDAGAALLALGVPVDAVLSLHREVAEAVEHIAAAYSRVYERHVRLARAGSAAAALAPIATSAVTASLVPALRRRLQPVPSMSESQPG